jgi:hypothetical protein
VGCFQRTERRSGPKTKKARMPRPEG